MRPVPPGSGDGGARAARSASGNTVATIPAAKRVGIGRDGNALDVRVVGFPALCPGYHRRKDAAADSFAAVAVVYKLDRPIRFGRAASVSRRDHDQSAIAAWLRWQQGV